MGAEWYPRLNGAFFWQMDDLNMIFRERDKQIAYAVLRSIVVSPRSQADTWSRQSLRRHAAMRAGGMNECQGTLRSEALDGKELHGAAGGVLEPK